MKKDVVVGKHEIIVKGAIERELRRRVDVINKRGYCCGMKRCGNIVKSCRNNVKDKNHVLN
jgi:hypothetical protein